MLENLQKIKIENPEHLGVSRGQVREAITKLQLYGIVKVQPQSGTTVNGIGIVALEGLITDILKLEQSDFKSLVETRILLEEEAARLAAINHTADDMVQMSNALNQYEEKLMNDNLAIEEDLLFHIKIAEAGKNSVLKSLMMIITPEIVKSFTKLKVCNKSNNLKTIKEHRNILEMISNKDAEGAKKAMNAHLLEVKKFSKILNNNIKPK